MKGLAINDITTMPLEERKITKAILHPRAITQVAGVAAFMIIITLAHNSVHLHISPLAMVLTQKLYFVPVVLAGFWSGLTGGFATALVSALLYPHRGSPVMQESAIFTAFQTTDIVLLFIVGGITGWLRNQLNAELEHHRRTAHERDQALKEAKLSHERARRSEHLASLGQMAAGIAHEVRNPLICMQGAVDILNRSMKDNPERAEVLLKRLQKDITRLDRLTRQIMEFARPPQALMKLIQPNAVIEESVEALRPQAVNKGITLNFSSTSDCPQIFGDHDQLKQVAFNLILNAIQFADPGSEILVSSSLYQGQWKLTVRNWGPVVPEKDRERIFDPFFTSHAKGTGLGLAIAARIAESHGGSLTLVCDDGTNFILSIPAANSAPQMCETL